MRVIAILAMLLTGCCQEEPDPPCPPTKVHLLRDGKHVVEYRAAECGKVIN